MPCNLTNIAITRDYGFGIAEQTNECTSVTPTNAIAVKSLSMPISKEFIDATGARGTHEILANDYLEGNKSYEGEVTLPAIPNFLGTLLVAAYGGRTTDQAGTNLTRFAHDNDPTRITVEGQFGRTNITWEGSVVSELEFASTAGADLEVTASFMGRASTHTSSATSLTPTKTQRAFQHSNATVTVYGTELPVSEITITIARPNVTPFYGNSLEPENLIVERPTEVTGSFTLPWSTQAFDVFENFEGFVSGEIVAHYVRGTNTLRFTMPQVIIEEGPASDLSDLSVSEYTLSFRALATNSGDSCKIELTSSA